MNTLINTSTSNQTRELSIDELSGVTGGSDQGTGNSGTNWGQVARVAEAVTVAAGNVATGVTGGAAFFTGAAMVNAAKQLRQ